MIFIITFVFILGVGLLIYMYKEAFADRVIQNVVTFSDFPESFGEVKIFFISDIHRRAISEKIIEEVQSMKADLVIIGGDLLEKGVPFERVKQNLQHLRKLGPVYFVWGNNDYEVDFRALDALLLDCGIKVLANTAVSFESVEGDKLILLGIDDIGKKRDRLDLALEDANETGFKILVSHNPQIISKIKKEHRIRLVLSGHTHGGQIHILGYSPYEKGSLKKRKETFLLISNGYGTTALPLRLGAKAETHLVTIKKG
ncbi:metallophosphoesterase family protein [Bacillus sp. FJAT-49705]|uniref:Metallophosphoesterase family protein n=1 Tax=Cytobacillus citreus TaxID=2833586 RepID=A0ABS5NUH8_9BACI|nr:metallophosphoesterase [Cytobacillus citreus]MBS4191063.1 metallophosphoesterase family protein [Cytobacillus citreus]